MSWISGFWTLIKLILEILGFIKNAQDRADAERRAEAERLRQAREKAIADQQAAQTEEEWNEAQDRIVDSKP